MWQEPHYRRRLCLRRTDIASMQKARARTLQMTIIVVLTYILCWTPYVIMALWYLFDPVSAEKVDAKVVLVHVDRVQFLLQSHGIWKLRPRF
ncbi:gonadotropin-releasing hormone II receptor [Nephila pilipes]|uniref:Gonadotropin-releasing hormone II receptor n=1 Tax=Nephila pilipes TaxID=299642 RepID=A0A8X6THQ7_NEPPI|nr:gonadotropin-releasing hormone II receptor [Nephila pilipes]